MDKAHLEIAGIALLAFMVVSFFQQKVMAVPVVGAYLPK